MKTFLSSLWQDEAGQDLAEYAMLVVLIAIVAIAGVAALGNAISGELEGASEDLFDTGGGTGG